MEAEIREILSDIEVREKLTILLAVESGSRAWGFASPDSDYDVRFIYVRPKQEYLRLDRGRDVIEFMPDDVLDVNGWDLDKALRLMHGSNPTLFEWLSSPIVYREHPLAAELRALSVEYFLARPGLHHYLSMAEGNYRDYLKGETVRLKKYFYVLRPLLACRHILSNGTPPPMRFEELVRAQMETAMIPLIEALLERKRVTPEMGEGERIDALNDYIHRSIPEIRGRIEQLPHPPKGGWEALNALFMKSTELKAGH